MQCKIFHILKTIMMAQKAQPKMKFFHNLCHKYCIWNHIFTWITVKNQTDMTYLLAQPLNYSSYKIKFICLWKMKRHTYVLCFTGIQFKMWSYLHFILKWPILLLHLWLSLRSHDTPLVSVLYHPQMITYI